MGGRTDQRDPRLRVPQRGDLGRHLGRGQLATLPGLGALGDLDLDLARVGEVFRRHPESRRRDLLDVAVGDRPEPRGILATFTAVGRSTHRTEAGGQRLVRLGRDRPVRDRRAREPSADRLDGLDIPERHRRPSRHRLEQVSRRRRGAFPHVIRVPLVQVVTRGVTRGTPQCVRRSRRGDACDGRRNGRGRDRQHDATLARGRALWRDTHRRDGI